MLPPQLAKRGLSTVRPSSNLARPSPSALPTVFLQSTASYHQSRRSQAWSRTTDWTSHLDPLYHRLTLHRSFKTKAKLLDKIRRRGKFDWDIAQRPFFTPRHIRAASHWNGRASAQNWKQDEESPMETQRSTTDTSPVGRSFELSQREKEWKQQMEAMRKRIEQDPYGAIFGKRFEPFWSPLVPSWMREEMGLQGWPKTSPSTKTPSPEHRRHSSQPSETRAGEAAEKPGQVSKEQPKLEPQPKASPDPSTYSTFSSTSWDSWTKKARRTEWDSHSGQTKRFEYDPISNRMVQIQGPATTSAPVAKEVSVTQSDVPSNRSVDMQSLINTPKELQTKAEAKSITPSVESRKPIPIPTASGVTHPAPSGLPEASAKSPAKGTTSPSNSAKLAKLPKDDMDILTASDVRASMGKLRHSAALAVPEKAALERWFDKKAGEWDAEATAILESRDAAKTVRQSLEPAEWDKAEQMQFLECELASLERKKNKLLYDEGRVFHIQKLKSEISKLDGKMNKVAEEIRQMTASTGVQPSRLETSLERASVPSHDTKSSPLQTSVQRMLPRSSAKDMDFDDSAAHESTEPFERQSNVPRNWEQQAQVLQAQRVERTTSSRSSPVPRWLDDMEARKAEFESAKKPISAEEQAHALKQSKASGLLEAEVQDQKSRMQAHESRYVHKIQSLRQELDTAYKQSAKHSGMHVERIRNLEAELEKLRKAVGDSNKSPTKTEAVATASGIEMRGEGDVCINAGKYAGNGKWYKQPAMDLRKLPLSPQDISKAEQKARDRALVQEVRSIYEDKYGVIDTKHRQPTEPTYRRNPVLDVIKRNKPRSVVEVETDVDLGEALAKHEKSQHYEFRRDSLEAELSGKLSKGEVVTPVRKGLSLEAESGQKGKQSAPADGYGPKPYGFNHDKLETELSMGAQEPASNDGYGPKPYGFKTDKLESELAIKQRREPESSDGYGPKDYDFVHDRLESELTSEPTRKAAPTDGYGPKPYNFRRDGLEGELVDEQGAQAAPSDGYGPKSYKFKHDKLEGELASKQRPSEKVQLENQIAAEEQAEHDGQSLSSKKSATKTASTAATSSSVQWQDPPMYKVLAYDAGNDILSTATTTSNFTGSEEAISIPQALSQLYQPARFVSHFAELQREGYQVIHGTRDLLVFKKTKNAATAASSAEAAPIQESLLVDHGLIKPKENALAEEAANFYDKYGTSEKPYDPTSIENGKLMPYENALAQEAANAYDNAVATGTTKKTDTAPTSIVHPIDGSMQPRAPAPTVSTGNFASPTGFVNHDPVFPDTPTSTDSKPLPKDEEDIDYKHYPRVRREEPVFSGTRRRSKSLWSGSHGSHRGSRRGTTSDAAEHFAGDRHHSRHHSHQRRRKGALRWMLGVGLSGVAVTYVIGVAAEAARQNSRETERWEQILEGKRGRWD